MQFENNTNPGASAILISFFVEIPDWTEYASGHYHRLDKAIGQVSNAKDEVLLNCRDSKGVIFYAAERVVRFWYLNHSPLIVNPQGKRFTIYPRRR